MGNFKVGDCVRFKKYAIKLYDFATADSYVIIGHFEYDDKIVLLDKCLKVSGSLDNTVHEDLIEKDLKYHRFKKLKQIFND